MQLHQRFRTLLLFCFLSLSFFAQRFPSKHFTISNGLPSNAVYCIFKDSRGLMWIGTDAGLVKYDGYKFQTISTRDGLAGNFIRDILEDKKGNLWIACYGDGLSRFDGKKFTNYTTKSGLVHNEIRTLYLAKDGRIFIGTERGLSIFSDNKFKNFLEKSNDIYDKFQVMKIWEKDEKLYFLSRTHGFYELRKRRTDERAVLLDIKNRGNIYNFEFQNNQYFSNDYGIFLKSKAYKTLNIRTKKKDIEKNLSNILVWDNINFSDYSYLAAYCPFCSNGGLFILRDNEVHDISKKYGITSKQVWSLYLDKRHNKLWVSTLDYGFYVIDLQPSVSFFKIAGLVNYDKNSKGELKLFTNELIFKSKKTNYSITTSEIINWAIQNNNKYKEIEKAKGIVKGNLTFELVKIWRDNDNFRFSQFGKNSFFTSTGSGLFEFEYSGKTKSFFPGTTNLFSILTENQIYWPNQHRLTYLLKRKAELWDHNPILLNGRIKKINETEVINHKGNLVINSPEKGILYLKKDDPYNFKVLSVQKPKTMEVWDNYLYVADKTGNINKFFLKDSLTYLRSVSHNRFYGEQVFAINHYRDNLIVLTNRGLNIIKPTNTILINYNNGLFFNDVIRTFVYNDCYYLVTSKGVFEIYLNQLNKSYKTNFFIESIIKFGSKKMDDASKVKGKISVIQVLPNEKGVIIQLGNEFVYSPNKVKLFYKLNQGDWTAIYDRKITIQKLMVGNYNLELKIINLDYGVTQQYRIAQIQFKAPFYKQTWFILLVIVISILIMILVFKQRIKTIKSKEKQKSALLKRIAETKLEALQSQMNPHFIFNALTAIQSYVLKSDIDKTLLYMDKFSKLTRQTLEFSSRLQITLLEELEYLSHFCALENMRFGDQVKVQFDAGELDTSKILIPPLLIQPLVENAFEHGFINREKAYELHLHFFIESEQLIVQVSDNGEGFETTTLYKPSSKAIHIIKERLSLLDAKLVEHFSINRTNNQTIIQFALPIVTL